MSTRSVLDDVRGVERWKATGPHARPSKIAVLRIEPSQLEDVTWHLPPSKSHTIRWTLMGAGGGGTCRLIGADGSGRDARAMHRMVQQLGGRIETDEGDWIIQGVGASGFTRPPSVLHAGNSGTAFRLIAATVATMAAPVMVDGDRNLRERGFHVLRGVLDSAGVQVSHGIEGEELPILLHGPPSLSEVHVDVQRSSQPLSALLIASPWFPHPIEVHQQGVAVSRRHMRLTAEIVAACGGPLHDLDQSTLILSPFDVEPPAQIQIPSDASMLPFAMLAASLHDITVHVPGFVRDEHALGHDLILDHTSHLALSVVVDASGVTICSTDTEDETVTIDIRDANDLITPLAALMAISGGGRILGAAHARWKESDRIHRTVQMLAGFGLHIEAQEDGLIIHPSDLKPPSNLIDTYGDHRLQMTAVLLASKVGGDVIGAGLHEVADPSALERLERAGARIESKLIQP